MNKLNSEWLPAIIVTFLGISIISGLLIGHAFAVTNKNIAPQSCQVIKGDSLVKVQGGNCEKDVDKLIDQGWKLFSYAIPNQSLDSLDQGFEVFILIKDSGK